MKVAVALRTCGSVFNYWNSDRYVQADKSTIILTCLNSLLDSIKHYNGEVVFSIHDDSSSIELKQKIEELCKSSGVNASLFDAGHHNNFKSQYEWIKEQECDYAYCLEDDYLHVRTALQDMIDMCEHMKAFLPADYGVYPFNNPHRYASPDMLYPSFVLRGPNQYWRSSFHSTHTFLIPKKSFLANDLIMRKQAYEWPSFSAVEDNTINLVWRNQETRLLVPMNSLAFHLADNTQEDKLTDWRTVWSSYETR